MFLYLVSFTYAEFTLQDFPNSRIIVVFTLNDYLGYHLVAVVFTMHSRSATGGYTSHDFTIGRIADNPVWSANYVS